LKGRDEAARSAKVFGRECNGASGRRVDGFSEGRARHYRYEHRKNSVLTEVCTQMAIRRRVTSRCRALFQNTVSGIAGEMAHGRSAGRTRRRLIDGLFAPLLFGSVPRIWGMCPVHLNGMCRFTTDSLVVGPPALPGGSIGELAVNGNR